MSRDTIVTGTKLTAIGNAIRAQTGNGELLTLDEMPNAIAEIGGEATLLDYLQDKIVAIEDDTTTSMPSYALAYLKTLQSAVFHVCPTVPGYCFFHCEALETVKFPSATTIYQAALQHCTSIVRIEKDAFPKLETIFDAAVYSVASFYNCTKLAFADFPSLTSIGGWAFGKTGLDTLILRAPTVARLTRETNFGSTPIADGTGYIYVPADLVSSYREAQNWSNYADQIRAIEDYPDVCDY